MRPEANLEAVIEAGRVILLIKCPKNLKEAAAAPKKLRRHTVGTDSEPNLTFWKVVSNLLLRIILKNVKSKKVLHYDRLLQRQQLATSIKF